MLSCKEVSQLASKSLDAPLTWRERGGIWLHLMFCKLCRRYVRQLHLLRKTFAQARKAGMQPLAAGFKLSAEGRDRIRRAFSEKRGP